MTHSNLLKVLSYIGLRASRKNISTNSIAAFPPSIPAVFPRSRIQMVENRSTLWQAFHSAIRDPRLVLGKRDNRLPMGQASSFDRGYSGTDESDDSERSKEGTDTANASDYGNGNVENRDEQNASAEEVINLKSVAEVVVSPEQGLAIQFDKNLERNLVSEDREANKPAETAERVRNEVREEAQTVLDPELELGEPPERPLPDDCCGQGCDICVWDTYNDELRDYLARRKSLLEKSK